jgi:FixJ family two-component response regulator
MNMSSSKGTVFVVDDNASIRKALERPIQASGYEVRTFCSAQEFLEQAFPTSPACLVLDVEMPGLSGLDLQAELRSRDIQTPIVFVTAHQDVPASVKAMKGGAFDFLTKPIRIAELLAVVHDAIRKDVQRQAARAETVEFQRRFQTLTPREREIFSLVTKGLLNKQIASELGAALRTVKVHRGRVMEKMGVKSVADLVRAAERLKLGEKSAAGSRSS